MAHEWGTPLNVKVYMLGNVLHMQVRMGSEQAVKEQPGWGLVDLEDLLSRQKDARRDEQ